MVSTRRKRVALAIYLLLFVSLSATCSAENNKEKHSRPNFILIVTDDQDVDSVKHMPKLQSHVIEKGITFTSAFVTSSVCAPSRGSILTGRYPNNTGITNNYKQFHGNSEQRTLATLLQEAGYRNALVGKYFNFYGKSSPQFIPPGWDRWHAIIDENTYYNYRLNENGTVVQYGNSTDDYITDVLSAKAAHFVDTQAVDTPFFLLVNTVAPHTPIVPAPKYENALRDIPVSFEFEDDVSDKPAWVQNYTSQNDKLIRNHFGNMKKMEEVYRKRWRTLLSVDDMIATLINQLKQKGLFENTYIFFLSDNGDGLSKHIPVSPKLSPYDEGIHVPFFVIGPHFPGNRKSDHLVSTVDILPTLADLADIEPFADIDGRSLVPLFTNAPPEGGWREAVFAHLGVVSEFWTWKSTPPPYQLMRTKNSKYIEYATGEREYYDLAADPDEMENIYTTLAPEVRQKLSTQLKELSAGGRRTK